MVVVWQWALVVQKCPSVKIYRSPLVVPLVKMHCPNFQALHIQHGFCTWTSTYHHTPLAKQWASLFTQSPASTPGWHKNLDVSSALAGHLQALTNPSMYVHSTWLACCTCQAGEHRHITYHLPLRMGLQSAGWLSVYIMETAPCSYRGWQPVQC